MLKAREAMKAILPIAILLAGLGAACGRAPAPVETPAPAPTASPTPYAPVTLRISQIETPADATVGRPVTVTVTVVLPNSCTEYRSLDASVDGAALRVRFTARGVAAQGAICAQILSFKPVAYTFTPPEPGVYVLASGDSEALATLDVR